MQKQSVWETSNYYKKAQKGSTDINHPGIKLLIDISKNKKEILDLGCGEGTRLSLISKKGTGIDISKKAIALAKENYSKHTFIVGNLEKLPFKNNAFDLVYSAYVFEHLQNPEKVIDQATRVLKKGATLVIICPNYGSPNRSSPPFKGSRVKKFILGFIKDLTTPFVSIEKLNWNKVKPIASLKLFDTDWDVTIEPYSLTLERYLKNNRFKVIKNIQTWEYELSTAKVHQKIFKVLGKMKIYPFNYWSPHIVIEAKKI